MDIVWCSKHDDLKMAMPVRFKIYECKLLALCTTLLPFMMRCAITPFMMCCAFARSAITPFMTCCAFTPFMMCCALARSAITPFMMCCAIILCMGAKANTGKLLALCTQHT